ncbi:hypothetical protein [Streptomyces variabilis]
MNDSTLPEDGEATSFREKAKDWAEKHPRTVHIIKAVGVTVGMAVVVAVLKPDSAEEDEAKFARQAEGTESSADSTEKSEQRNSPGKHNVVPHKRRLKDGRVIDVSGYERGGSAEDEDEGPGEAAA